MKVPARPATEGPGPSPSVLERAVTATATFLTLYAAGFRSTAGTAGSCGRRLQRTRERGALRQLDPVAVGIAHHRNPGGGAERHRRAGLNAAMAEHESVLAIDIEPVSYTHLTLPTIYSV